MYTGIIMKNEIYKSIRKPVPKKGFAFKNKKAYARKNKWGNKLDNG